MKIQIDTSQNLIKIEESVNLGELIEKLDQLFPNGEWKKYKLEVTVINNWSNPIVIKEPYIVPSGPTVTPYPQPQPQPQPYSPDYPNYPWITWCETSVYKQTEGNGNIYNLIF